MKFKRNSCKCAFQFFAF